MTAMAPQSEVMEKVRMPAAARSGPVPLRRSRSMPISRPMPSATARLRIRGLTGGTPPYYVVPRGKALTYFFVSAFRIFPESVTKPKHFFTFHTVASVQKSGEVVAQQSSTSTQP